MVAGVFFKDTSVTISQIQTEFKVNLTKLPGPFFFSFQKLKQQVTESSSFGSEAPTSEKKRSDVCLNEIPTSMRWLNETFPLQNI